jgi:hypothetical protein
MFALGFALTAAFGPPMGTVFAATGGGEVTEVSAAMPASRTLGDVADLTLRFVQEDGPEDGHVRVELTPETRPLTMMEARVAAERGFLAALNEPALADNLSRITVVVKLMPATHPDPGHAEQVVVYHHAGGSSWSIRAGE